MQGTKETSVPNPLLRRLVRAVQRIALAVSVHWLFALNGFLALYIGGAYMAPVLAATNHVTAANVVYTAYSFTCHQLPQRSYFFFGENDAFFATYSKEAIVAQGADPTNDLTLREFRGTPELGYKAANAHRLSALYFGALVGGLLYAAVRRFLKEEHDIAPIPLWLLALMTIPMAVDGTSHLISEVTRLGFRETNTWAIALTGGLFSDAFYTGTTIGTLNWLLRTVTGILFGAGVVWYTYPLIGLGFEDVRREAEQQFEGRYTTEATQASYDMVGSDV